MLGVKREHFIKPDKRRDGVAPDGAQV
jgi:hypothetical protein